MVNIATTTPYTDLPENLTVQQAADFLGVSDRTVRLWVKSNSIPYKRVGPRLIFIPRDRLRAYLEDRDGRAERSSKASVC